MEPIIGIIENNPAKVAQMLNVVLADEFLLYTKTKNAHQNLDDNDLYLKLMLFKEQYEQLENTMDSIAARIHSTGYNIPVTPEIFLELEHLAEQSLIHTNGVELIHELLEDHESLIIRLQKKAVYFGNELQEPGVGRYIIELMEIHQRMMLELKIYL
ncbi:starvation-inducible DNA-binding protein [Pedobacter cryoconitis]|uniref:Starvation-inducible DNA-binding protein n=1 Tax=Pedobacter cryoconitis TaxID=188932 RepID=A0A7W8YWB7_9SPHI|nr:DNA starvation/stationary phase protection protein [Pedobacter cryoconitis]MBB5622968.1 starvation-inducible DNA-binding protein [Pedobacter cryoconitis]MBB5644981.1 starvation-inducible DNA-binding protein [Pedobacter cryoconitis]